MGEAEDFWARWFLSGRNEGEEQGEDESFQGNPASWRATNPSMTTQNIAPSFDHPVMDSNWAAGWIYRGGLRRRSARLERTANPVRNSSPCWSNVVATNAAFVSGLRPASRISRTPE